MDGTRLALDEEARLVSVDVDLDGELFGRCEVSFHDPSLKLIDGKHFQSGTAVTTIGSLGVIRASQRSCPSKNRGSPARPCATSRSPG